ncbi:MAG: nucleotidyl transferase AbiEii/AbiGii toxin family protein [Bacilli bacterium]|nr:nucleotidyl transferase AbiEii/AbiGii toxin family protein [Bacilli bacterium]
MNLSELIQKYIENGYDEPDAMAKVCQDVILLKIDKSGLREHITIKGGVVMHSISKDMRRATRDMDMDFIKYSLDDISIKEFVSKLNNVDDGIIIDIVGNITKLHHQDYDGKRVNIKVSDMYGNIIDSKLDIGVHKEFDIKQDDYYFDLTIINKSTSLLINSKEQIFVEKLKSLLKFGIRSTRYKDVFDFYYLISYEKLNKEKLLKYMKILIFKDSLMEENNIEDVVKRITSVLNNSRYKNMLSVAENNWLQIPAEEVINEILMYFESLKHIHVYN